MCMAIRKWNGVIIWRKGTACTVFTVIQDPGTLLNSKTHMDHLWPFSIQSYIEVCSVWLVSKFVFNLKTVDRRANRIEI